MKRLRSLLAMLALVAFAGPAFAQGLAAPKGPVIVTVTGDIANVNRGPFDPDQDAVFKNQKIGFDRAAAFDLAMLEGLGMRRIHGDFPKGAAPRAFEGPLLRDVMKAVGARGKTLKIVAIDGYTGEIPVGDLDAYPVILALKRDGRYFGIGDFGPSWIVYPRPEYPALKDSDDSKWVYAIAQISVE
ncbi:MAG: molybdopterin-dependent oxidoreductase [Rhodospirillales bacterium]|nr:molybdopterin-dependent oxidoreductase [Rhodospirillales bacterium]